MYSIVIGSLLLSLLHAVIPSHWLPVLAIGSRNGWTIREVTRVTFIAGLAHAASTILIGIALGLLGMRLSAEFRHFTHLATPGVLILLGIFFLYRHHRHFHLEGTQQPAISKNRLIATLVLAMLLSPCMEIEAYFLLAGTEGPWMVAAISVMYLSISVSGMVIWVRLAYRGLLRFKLRGLEHRSGTITGWTLVITGILSFFIS